MAIIKNPIIINKKVITEDITVTPSTEEQTINRSEDKYINSVTVNAVTSNIDTNITPENIKKDVSILGVTGTLQSGSGGGAPLIATTDAEMMALLNSDNAGKIVQFAGVSDIYEEGAFYLIYEEILI